MNKIIIKSLHIQVAHQIREMIHKGELQKGQKIKEKELCATLGVSRTPVREALRTLSSEGLIELIQNKGAYVSQPRLEEIKNMFDVMSTLEGTCARIAAERMTPGGLERLEALHRDLEKHYQDRDHDGYLKTNHTFHSLVQELAGNPILNDIINGLRQKILLYRSQQLYQPERFNQSIQEHRDLLEAFRQKEPLRAETVMKSHLMKQCAALVGLYENKV